ncbi:MAG: YbaK/prolyl-tRNA synthetase associated region [Anaerolineales bacterium]|nr:YbaK/prolyl-tRNA synthetase associated region [Anaerolineales bacterium]
MRQSPAGLDRMTAPAVRGGYLRVTSQGVIWLPLGARLVDRLRGRLSGTPQGPILAGPDSASSPILEMLRPDPRSDRELPLVLSSEWSPRSSAARSLKDTETLGVLEWGAAAVDADQAQAALGEVEKRLIGALARCGLDLQHADGLGRDTQWAQLTDDGPALFLRCSACGYLAERATARFGLAEPPIANIEALREVHVAPSATLKALFLTADGETLLALLRGDLEASLEKVRHEIGAKEVRPAAPEEISRLGVVAGYAGPVGLKVRPERRGHGVWVVADRSIVSSANLVTGANRDGFHLLGVNYPRDFAVTETFDFARAPRGAPCAACGGALAEKKGLVLARRRAFEQGFVFARGEDGLQHGAMVSLQVSLGAVTAAVITAARQETGFKFPATCSPFHVHLIELAGGPDLTAALEEMDGLGLEVLVDDRDLSAGVKFAEADWIGAPVQVVAGRKSFEGGGVEMRTPNGEKRIIRTADLIQCVLDVTGEVM